MTKKNKALSIFCAYVAVIVLLGTIEVPVDEVDGQVAGRVVKCNIRALGPSSRQHYAIGLYLDSDSRMFSMEFKGDLSYRRYKDMREIQKSVKISYYPKRLLITPKTAYIVTDIDLM